VFAARLPSLLRQRRAFLRADHDLVRGGFAPCDSETCRNSHGQGTLATPVPVAAACKMMRFALLRTSDPSQAATDHSGAARRFRR
jgi:hypothetical protein